MGTRADFYIGTGKDAEWLGSIAFDGYRINEMTREQAEKNVDCMLCWHIKNALTEAGFRASVSGLLRENDDATKPEQGWPWPWDDSNTTDYAYAFVDGACKTFTEAAEWPDMSARKNVTFGPRSGVILIQG